MHQYEHFDIGMSIFHFFRKWRPRAWSTWNFFLERHLPKMTHHSIAFFTPIMMVSFVLTLEVAIKIWFLVKFEFSTKFKILNETSDDETNDTMIIYAKNAVEWWVIFGRWRTRKKIPCSPRSGAPLAEKMKIAHSYIKMTAMSYWSRIHY